MNFGQQGASEMKEFRESHYLPFGIKNFDVEFKEGKYATFSFE